jgi:hypothetical protein
MKSRVLASALLLAAGGLAGWWYGGRGDAAATAQQPPPQNCLWRLQKEGKGGSLKYKLDAPHKCVLGQQSFSTAEGTGDLDLKFHGGGTPCDELATARPGAFPPGSRLVVTKGRIVHRDTVPPSPRQVAVYTGKFAVKDPNGKDLFLGDLEIILGIGPNHAPLPQTFGSERCDRPDRMEGWLRSRASEGEAKGLELHAVLVARIDPGADQYAVAEFTLDGVVVGH